MSYQSLNPFNSQLFASYPVISDLELELKIEQTQKAYNQLKNYSFSERSKILLKVSDLLTVNKKKHAELITLEMGKPISQSIAEIEKCAWTCQYYADNAESFLKQEVKASTAKLSFIRFDPLGIIYAIMPWNFPYWQVFRWIAPTFMAGNAGLLKHASNVPQCALAIENLFSEAGAPSGCLNNLFIDYQQSEKVIKHRHVRGVTITGSNLAGSITASLAGKYFKKSVLELGGSDPFIIFADTNLQKAVDHAVLSRFQNTGQSCIASKRFFVEEPIFDKFIELFIQNINALKIGDPMKSETYIGPLAKADIVDELELQVNQAIASGTKVLTGGKRQSPGSNFYLPTVVKDVPSDSNLLRLEIFGPVAPVLSFKTIDEAIILANDTDFGLAATVWTTEKLKIEKLVAEINTGTIVVNGMVKSEPSLPFGGIKDSGYGRELSNYGIKEFVNIKTVNYF